MILIWCSCSMQVCLENRYCAIEPRTDTLDETEKTIAVLEKPTGEQMNVVDNDKVSTKTE